MAALVQFKCPCCGATRTPAAYGIDEETEAFVGHAGYPATRISGVFGGRGQGFRNVERGPLSLDAAQALLECLDLARARLKAEIDMAVNGEED